MKLPPIKKGLKLLTLFDRPDGSDYVYLDFLYRGRLSLADQRNDEAMQWFEKALEADAAHEHPEIAKEASAAHEKLQNYPEAIRLYQVYLDGLKGKAEVSDMFLMGRLYYIAAGSSTANETEKEAYLKKADEIFAEVSQRVPDNYLAILRAAPMPWPTLKVRKDWPSLITNRLWPCWKRKQTRPNHSSSNVKVTWDTIISCKGL